MPQSHSFIECIILWFISSNVWEDVGEIWLKCEVCGLKVVIKAVMSHYVV